MIEFNTTDRRFALGTFQDLYGTRCSIQKSSLATENAIWLGVDDAEPMIMAKDAAAYGIETTKTCGWVPFPVPNSVFFTTRMHLTVDQVKQLLPVLQRFVDTGELPQVPA